MSGAKRMAFTRKELEEIACEAGRNIPNGGLAGTFTQNPTLGYCGDVPLITEQIIMIALQRLAEHPPEHALEAFMTAYDNALGHTQRGRALVSIVAFLHACGRKE